LHKRLLNYKAFTLVEVVAGLAIVAIMIMLVFFGIRLGQKKARDIDRTDILNRIKVEISAFQNKTGRVPDPTTQMTWTTNSVIIGSGTSYAKTVQLTGSSAMKAVNNTQNETLGDSDANGTIYYYWVLKDGYVLGADREDGVANVGTSKTIFGASRP
jgi:prepilin-type N-terminal cleavage/methylation domain-containing protein